MILVLSSSQYPSIKALQGNAFGLQSSKSKSMMQSIGLLKFVQIHSSHPLTMYVCTTWFALMHFSCNESNKVKSFFNPQPLAKSICYGAKLPTWGAKPFSSIILSSLWVLSSSPSLHWPQINVLHGRRDGGSFRSQRVLRIDTTCIVTTPGSKVMGV